MRRVLPAALALLLSGVVSCSDMPTAPAANVTVTGTVTDRDGAAVSSAYVTFHQPASSSQPPFVSPEFFGRTDPAGAFKVAMPEGTYEVNIHPEYESGLPQATIPRFKVGRHPSPLNYRFSGTKVSGTITGPGGIPLDGAAVTAASSVNGFVTGRTVAGHYSIVVPPGAYEVYVYPGGYDSGLPRLEIEATISAADTVMDFALTGREVSVTAFLGGATPLAGVTVIAESPAIGVRAAMATGIDGAGVLYLPDGSYNYSAYPPNRAIVGPELGTWNVTGDASFALDFPATRWNITLRRSSDNGPIAFARIDATERGSFRHAGEDTDALGRILLIVRPDVGYDFTIGLRSSITPNFFTITNVSSSADSTFDLYVNAPVP